MLLRSFTSNLKKGRQLHNWTASCSHKHYQLWGALLGSFSRAKEGRNDIRGLLLLSLHNCLLLVVAFYV